MLDIELFRQDKGGNPDLIRESQKRRFADVTLVDKVIEADNIWRRLRGRVDILRKYQGIASKAVGLKMKNKENPGDAAAPLPDQFANKDQDGIYLDAILGDKNKADAEMAKLTVEQLKKLSKDIATIIEEAEVRLFELEKKRDKTLCEIGNLVHESCVVSDNEDNNGIVRTFEGSAKALLAEKQQGLTLLNHVDLMKKLGGMECDQGALVAGNRGYFLTGPLVRLNLALIQYSIDFLSKRGYTPIYPPYFMNKGMMGEVAQLEQFDDELYKVSGEGEDKYLIATSEQPIVAFHKDKWFEEKQLPLKWVGYSACFRKEVGAHGRDTLGIFRVHQFEKIEQFLVTTPKDNKSWEAMETMIKNSEDFYQTLGLTYQVVNIVSGKLNNAAAKKLDLEAWFPASKTYRELVSCSNCTDYQSRRVNCRFGQSKKAEGGSKEYVHMLNSTLCATTRVMCCICENYQTKDGVIVPEVLRNYLGGLDFMPFTVVEQEKPEKKKK